MLLEGSFICVMHKQILRDVPRQQSCSVCCRLYCVSMSTLCLSVLMLFTKVCRRDLKQPLWGGKVQPMPQSLGLTKQLPQTESNVRYLNSYYPLKHIYVLQVPMIGVHCHCDTACFAVTVSVYKAGCFAIINCGPDYMSSLVHCQVTALHRTLCQSCVPPPIC